MPRITRGAKQVGTVTIGSTEYDLIQIQRAVWVVDQVNDTTVERFRSREKLLARYPHARFEEKD